MIVKDEVRTIGRALASVRPFVADDNVCHRALLRQIAAWTSEQSRRKDGGALEDVATTRPPAPATPATSAADARDVDCFSGPALRASIRRPKRPRTFAPAEPTLALPASVVHALLSKGLDSPNETILRDKDDLVRPGTTSPARPSSAPRRRASGTASKARPGGSLALDHAADGVHRSTLVAEHRGPGPSNSARRVTKAQKTAATHRAVLARESTSVRDGYAVRDASGRMRPAHEDEAARSIGIGASTPRLRRTPALYGRAVMFGRRSKRGQKRRRVAHRARLSRCPVAHPDLIVFHSP